MRAALILCAFGLWVFVGGCYLSHAAPIPVDAGVPVDAPPTCTARCEPPTTIVRLDGTELSLGFLREAVVRDGVLFVLFRGPFADLVTYAVVQIDLRTGSVLAASRVADMTTQALTVADLGVTPDALVVTALTTDTFARFAVDPRVSRASFDRGGALTGPEVVGALPFSYAPCTCALRGSVFGRDASEALVVLEHGDLWLTRLDLATGAPGETERFAAFPDAPPRPGAVQGIMLDDGRVVAVGGGSGAGLEPREAFVAVEAVTGEVLVSPLPGERFDPPPHLVATGDRFGLARYVSNPRDAADGRLIAEVRDGAGGIVDGLEVRSRYGLPPAAYAAYRGRGGPGVVWVETDATLRVLPEAGSGTATSWSECDGVTVSPSHTSDLPLSVPAAWSDGSPTVVALDPGDGSGDVVVILHVEDPSFARFDVLRIPGCRLDHAR